MIRRHTISLVLTVMTMLVAAGQAHSQIAYITNGPELFSFDLTTPGAVTHVGSFTGATTFLDGLDFRPADRQLYGYDQDANQVVQIDVATAATTFVSTPSTGSNTSELGLDFNPVADRLRLVNTNAENLRINVDTGVTTSDFILHYAAGDPHELSLANVIEAAYTNSGQNPGTGTTLFYIDYLLDILATTSDPNGGTLNTVGPLGVNTFLHVGFDIFTNGGNNFAYALLDPGIQFSSPSLYSINLVTGEATLIGALSGFNGSTGTFFYGLAITPVPEPGSLALLATGLIGAVIFRFRKRTAV